MQATVPRSSSDHPERAAGVDQRPIPVHRALVPQARAALADAPAAVAPAMAPAPRTWLDVTAADDSATLHSRLERTPDARIGLVLAPDARVLRRPLDYQLLGRLAEELGLDVAIATADVERRRLAREFGFAVTAPETPRRLPGWRVSRSTAAGALAALVAVALAVVGLPHTSVRLSPTVAPLTREAIVAVDLRPGAIGHELGQVAGKQLTATFDVQQTHPATGRQSVGDVPSKGYVTLYDSRPYVPPAPVAPPPPPAPAATSAAPSANSLAALLGRSRQAPALAFAPPAEPTAQPAAPAPAPPPPPERVIPAGTAVVSADGQRFFTQSEVRLAPSGYATVAITAEYPGSAGNLPAGAINQLEDPQFGDVRVENRLPTWGGSDRQVAVVSQDDRDTLHQALAARAQAEAPSQLASLAGDEYLLLPDTITTGLDESYDYAAGQEAEQVSGSATVRAQAIALPKQAVAEAAAQQWRAQVPGGLMSVGTPRLSGPPAIKEQDDEHLIVAVPVEGQVTPSLDSTALAAELRGQPLSAIESRLASLPGLRTPPQIDVWPAWAPATLRVDVTIDRAR